MTFPQQTSHANFVTIDPFHLDFHACAMDWKAQSAGSRGEHVSWVADRAHICISLVLVVVKTSHFTVHTPTVVVLMHAR